jgi:hypothetical protein
MYISGVLGGVAVIYRQLPDHSSSDFIAILEKAFHRSKMNFCTVASEISKSSIAYI